MASVLLLVDRPGLADALAERGLDLARSGDRPDAVVATVACRDGPCRDRPCLVLAVDDDAQAALLDAGVDDVVAADAGPALIAARVAALIRRSIPVVRIGDLVIDTIARSVVVGGQSIALLPREYALLLHLARSPGIAVTRGALREAVWGLDFDPGTNVIAVHVSRLRAKLQARFDAPILLTDKGLGYRLIAKPEIATAAAAG